MQLFSQRAGITPIREIIQKESVDHKLKNDLWNATFTSFFKLVPVGGHYYQIALIPTRGLINTIWTSYLNKGLDQLSNLYRNAEILDFIKKDFFATEWYKIYDILEFISNNYFEPGDTKKKFFRVCNQILSSNLSAYRFVNGMITEISSEEEITAIEAVLSSKVSTDPTKLHINTALELFSDRVNPDYRNSIKESISAVEACCHYITGNPKATLGEALAIIEKKYILHKALQKSFTALYGYTSDADGIRHAMLDDNEPLSQEDAKFMLVSCSAFINYLLVKNLK